VRGRGKRGKGRGKREGEEREGEGTEGLSRDMVNVSSFLGL